MDMLLTPAEKSVRRIFKKSFMKRCSFPNQIIKSAGDFPALLVSRFPDQIFANQNGFERQSFRLGVWRAAWYIVRFIICLVVLSEIVLPGNWSTCTKTPVMPLVTGRSEGQISKFLAGIVSVRTFPVRDTGQVWAKRRQETGGRL